MHKHSLTSRTSIGDHRRRRTWTLSTCLHLCSVQVQLLERMTDVVTGMRRQFIDRFDDVPVALQMARFRHPNSGGLFALSSGGYAGAVHWQA